MQGHLKTLNSRFFPTKRNEPKIQKRTLQRGETHDDLRTYNPAKVKHADFRVVREKHLSRCMMGQAGPCIRIAYKDCKKKTGDTNPASCNTISDFCVKVCFENLQPKTIQNILTTHDTFPWQARATLKV